MLLHSLLYLLTLVSPTIIESAGPEATPDKQTDRQTKLLKLFVFFGYKCTWKNAAMLQSHKNSSILFKCIDIGFWSFIFKRRMFSYFTASSSEVSEERALAKLSLNLKFYTESSVSELDSHLAVFFSFS